MVRKFHLLLILGIIAISGVTSTVMAGEGRLRFVETEVLLFPDGKASVEYVVRYTVISREFHGFYFEGLDRLIPLFDRENASAIDSQGNTYGLDIKGAGPGRYDIVLDRGRSVTSGDITYRFRFAADMADAGYLALTSTDNRDLVVFNWAPTKWDSPLDHYTVKVIYPLEYTSQQTDRTSIETALLAQDFAAERWMNQEYRIDYRLREVGGRQQIEVLLHKEDTSR